MTPKVYIPEEFYELYISLSEIVPSPALDVDLHLVAQYSDLYEDGFDPDPLTVVEEINDRGIPSGRFLLVDGYHRFAALLQIERTVARCTIYRGDILTAVLLGARKNGGCRRSMAPEDCERIVKQILLELATRGVTWPDQQLADWATIDPAIVAAVRAELKHEPGMAIPDVPDAMPIDGAVSCETPRTPNPSSERERDEPFQREQFNMEPREEEYMPPPPPRQSSRGPLYVWTAQRPPQSRTPGAPRQPAPPLVRPITYDFDFQRNGDYGVQTNGANEETIHRLPRDVRAQLLRDLEIPQAVERLLRDLGIVREDEPLPEELQEKVQRFLRI